jgi:trans-aconitate methyltransferase
MSAEPRTGLLDSVTTAPSARVADVACGPGAELDARAFTGVELVVSDATGTTLDPGSFDLVHERFVLNNVLQPDAVLAEMVTCTSAGGCPRC